MIDVHLDGVEEKKREKQKRRRGIADLACRTTKRPSDVHDLNSEEEE